MAETVVAIDGPAGSGKSTTARAVADRMGLAHLDSGALYRALTWAAMQKDIAFEDGALIELALVEPVRLGLKDGAFHPLVGETDVSKLVRSDEVTAQVSTVAALPGVRNWATTALREAAELHPRGVVCDGRDIGSVVFPNAGLKVFLTASVEERARRRALEQRGSADADQIDEFGREIAKRDRADSVRAVSPLVQPEDAAVVDTSRLTIEEQVNRIIQLARKAFA